MEPASEKIKQWIEQGRDPRTAHWQVGLEALLDVFSSFLEPGLLVPALALKEDELLVYKEAMEIFDISPNVGAVFLPPAVAGKIRPPESATELVRIDEDKPSYKILLQRSGPQPRIACIEISSFARNPGVDLFQDGALLGSYDFKDHRECMDSISQIIRTHMWEKGKWSNNDYRRYTVNWFERVIDTGKGDIAVQTDFSFFHTPSLIKSNPVDVIFTLIYHVFERRLRENDGMIRNSIAPVYELHDKKAREERFYEMSEKTVLHYLNVIRDLELIDFTEFSKKQTNHFKQATTGAINKISRDMEAAGSNIS